MTIPIKTALGHEELKSRTHRLGQRHRTILFLVDGRRPLSEVLSLAQQAGAATAHFEELVRLGLVEVPAEPEPAEPPPPVEESQAEVTEVLLDAPEVEAAEVVQADEVEAVEAVEAEPAASAEPAEATAPSEPAEATAPSEPAEATAPFEPAEATAPSAPVEATAPSAPVEAPGPTEPPPRPPAAEAELAPPAPPAPRPVPREIPVLGEEAAVEPLQQVRELLVDALRFDAPLFSARMFMRVRNAQTTQELIELVWEIQAHLTRARHAQRELRSLQRAREILGLGNTLVAEDSTRPPHLDE